jgi:flagellar motor switch protein FliN/FliY
MTKIPNDPPNNASVNDAEMTPSHAPGAEANDKPYTFSSINESSGTETLGNMDFILDVPLEISVELGRTRLLINDLLKLGQGSVIELTKAAGETLEILANQRPIARGEVVSINDNYGIRLTEIISPIERLEGLK